MTDAHYRSYLVRIRRRGAALGAGDQLAQGDPGSPPATVRADVEDLLGGARARIHGEEARLLAADLEAFIQAGDTAHGELGSAADPQPR